MSNKDLNREHERQVVGLEVDPGLAWKKQLLGRLIVGQTIAVSVLALVVTIVGLLASESDLLALVPLGVIAAVVGLVAYWLLRRGQLELASYVFLLGTSVAITSNVFVRGYQDVSGIYYLWPIVGAVFLLGTQGGIAVTVVSALLYLGMVVLQGLGIQTPPLPVDPQADVALTVISRLLMFFLLAFMGWLASQNLDRALQQSRQTARRWKDLSETLEQRVAERTHDLEQLTLKLATAADVGRAVTSILELETLVPRVVDLVRERFNLYYAALFLLDDAGEYAVLEAGTGETGHLMKERGHKLEVNGISMVGSACALREARIALDVGDERVRFDNPLLPETRSEMALPLMVGERVLGALDVQSTKPDAFSEEDISALQLMADQVAVAVDNARKFSQEAEVLEATSPVFRISYRLGKASTTEQIVQAVINTVAETEADGCAVGRWVLSPDGEIEGAVYLGAWSRHDVPHFPLGTTIPPERSPIPFEMATTFWVVEDILEDTQVPKLAAEFLTRFGIRSLTNIPLSTGEQLIGFVSVDKAAPGPFSPASLQIYRSLVEQAALALERARLLEETQRRAARDRLVDQIASQVQGLLDPDIILKTTVRELGRVLGARMTTVEITGPRDNGDDLPPAPPEPGLEQSVEEE